MKIYKEITPWEFLQDYSWCCEYLKEMLSSDCEDAFNALIEDACAGQDISETTLNDMLRFDIDWIIECLGLSAEEEY